MEKTPKDECHNSSPECPHLHFLPILNAPESCVCAESSLQLKAAYGSNSLHVLVETMKTHEDVEVQLFGTMGIASVCNGADWECQKHAANAGVLEALLHAIRYGSQLPAVQQWVARCFECLPLILRSFIKTLKDHPEDAKLQVLSAMCLARMHRAESYKEAADAGVAKAFVQAMQTHALDAEVQNAAAFGLYVNCRAANPERCSPSHLAGETTQCALDHGAPWALLEAARTHGQNPAVLYNCTLALGSIVWSRASVCGEHAAEIVHLLLRTLKWNRKDFRVRMLASNCLRSVPKAMRHLVEAMNFVPFDGDVQHWSSWCLAEACSEEVVGQDVLGYPSDPVLRALVSAMQNHAADAQLQFHAAMALGTICAGWDVNAFKRQNEAIDAGALQVVVQATII